MGFHTSGIDKFGLLELPLLLCSQVKVIRTRYIFPLTSYNKQDSNREEQSFSMDLSPVKKDCSVIQASHAADFCFEILAIINLICHCSHG